MLNPFPGMNPYLEQSELWHQVKIHLIVGIADAIANQIAPQYRVSIEERIYPSIDEPRSIIGLSVKERYLEVREVATKELITVIEVLSPINKRSGKGRSIYETKRTRILTSMTNLIEIDLLRSGQPMEMTGATESHYRILVSRSIVGNAFRNGNRPSADLFRFNLQDPIPDFPVPLRPESPDAIVDLSNILNETYQRGRLDLSIDYSQDLVPALSESDRIWALEIVNAVAPWVSRENP
jgi:Protein of unknown function (DUF4058)